MVYDAKLNRATPVDVELTNGAVKTEATRDPPPPYTLHKISQPSKVAPVPRPLLDEPTVIVREPNPRPVNNCRNPRPQSSNLREITTGKAIREFFCISLYWICFPCMWSASLCCAACPEPSNASKNKCLQQCT